MPDKNSTNRMRNIWPPWGIPDVAVKISDLEPNILNTGVC